MHASEERVDTCFAGSTSALDSAAPSPAPPIPTDVTGTLAASDYYVSYSIEDEAHGTMLKVEVTDTTREIMANGLPPFEPGEFPNPGNPGTLEETLFNYSIPLIPEWRGTPEEIREVGVSVLGIPMEPGNAFRATCSDGSSPSLEVRRSAALSITCRCTSSSKLTGEQCPCTMPTHCTCVLPSPYSRVAASSNKYSLFHLCVCVPQRQDTIASQPAGSAAGLEQLPGRLRNRRKRRACEAVRPLPLPHRPHAGDHRAGPGTGHRARGLCTGRLLHVPLPQRCVQVQLRAEN